MGQGDHHIVTGWQHLMQAVGLVEVLRDAAFWIPGSFDAVVCLGAVIRGGTPHFDYVALEVAKGVAHAGMETGVPTVFGVLTADSIEQAVERAGTKAGNRGWDAAMAAMELADLYARMG